MPESHNSSVTELTRSTLHLDRFRVLHLITHLGIGGAQDNTLLTVKDILRKRYEVHLAAGLPLEGPGSAGHGRLR